MATVSDADYPALDMREQLVRIDKMQAELNTIQIEMTKRHVDTDTVRLDARLAPWALVITSLGAGAALFAAGAAFTKLLIG